MKLRVLDLFSGIGGFSLGLERTGGFETVAFCEIEEYPRRVLSKHWPDVPIYDDVRRLTHEQLQRDGIAVDVICGGFPCQDISLAGDGAGIEGERSGLWSEFARLIGEVRPRYALVENVAALLGRGMGVVLGDLAALGYDAEWHCIPASAVGAPHQRDRVWIVSYPDSEYRWAESRERGGSAQGAWDQLSGIRFQVANASSERRGEARQLRHKQSSQWAAGSSEKMADTHCPGRQKLNAAAIAEAARQHTQGGVAGGGVWATEPDVGRVADGVPARVDRLRGLGNAVVPQIPELLGRMILAAEQRRAAA